MLFARRMNFSFPNAKIDIRMYFILKTSLNVEIFLLSTPSPLYGFPLLMPRQTFIAPP